ncbi:MAG: type II secretion system protein GspL [Candidatus Sedimenticola sp. (ex Thyasira tokunagai)]
MSELLLVRANTEQDGQYTWLPVDKKGNPRAQAGTGTLGQLAAQAKHRRLVLLLPGSDLLLSTVTIPGTGRAPASAVTFALEEQLADEVDGLYITSGPRQGGGEIPVAAIRKERLNHLLDSLKQAGYTPHWCLPESILLPWREGGWSLLEEGEQVTLRVGKYLGMGIETASLQPVLMKLLQEWTGEEPPVVQLWSDSKASQLPRLLENLGCSLEQVQMPTSVLQLLTTEVSSHPHLDLLQTAQRQGEARGSSGRWLAVAAMLLLALIVYIGGNGYNYWQLKKEQAVVTGEINQRFKKAFPDITRVVDPLVQAEQALAKRQHESGLGRDQLLTLLHRAGSALKQDKTVQLIGLEFRQGIIQMRLQSKGVGSVESFKQRLEKSGRLEAEVTSANSNKKGVEARVKIKEKAS